ncbi:hypothetical protein [Haloferula sargassicola]|uniref:Lipoprotein n=1 Tax=Haloferula sargassicola TaxID=490096 RepID=A0ABP9UTY5_9BACT
MFAGVLLAVACDPPAESPEAPTPPGKKDPAAVEVLKEVGRSLDEMGERIANTGETAKKPDKPAEAGKDPATGEAEAATEPGTGPDKPATPVAIPVAEPAEGKPGYIVSPFSGKLVDVRGIAAGTLVQDPDFPAEEKKYFRVPEGADEVAEDPSTPAVEEGAESAGVRPRA